MKAKLLGSATALALFAALPIMFPIQIFAADESEEWKKTTDAANDFLFECLERQLFVQIQSGMEPLSFIRLMPKLCKNQYDLFSQAFIGRARARGFPDGAIKGKLSETLTDITSRVGASYSELYEKKRRNSQLPQGRD